MYKTIVILMLVAFTPFAKAVDVQKLVKETQQISQTANRLTFVWWVPTEFWRQSLQSNPQITEERASRLTALLDEYSVFVVVVTDIGPMAGMSPVDRASIAANTEFRIDNRIIPLLDNNDISADAQNFVGMMKPVFSNMLGQFGKGMEFYIYPNHKNGKKLLDPVENGQFSYTVFGKRFDWRLPLGSCLPPRIDPKTGEEFPGNYIFNPYTGDKLVVKEKT
jgi:hypothetical protein